MGITQERLVGQLEREIAAIADPRVSKSVNALLIKPMPMQCSWDYGSPGETYPCWKIAESAERAIGIIYCEQGFGPKCPWGLVWLREPVPAMGQDSGWFPTFREAAADILDLPAASLNV